MSKKDYNYKSIIHHPKGGYDLHEKEMIIPKVITEDYSWEMVTGMKYIPEKSEIKVSDAMFRSGTDKVRVSDNG